LGGWDRGRGGVLSGAFGPCVSRGLEHTIHAASLDSGQNKSRQQHFKMSQASRASLLAALVNWAP
jgi:hypothetical protein